MLISVSTTDQGQADLLQGIIDAVGRLPVRAVATLGPAVDPSDLRTPPNVVVHRYLPHHQILDQCALVITHAGHGTVLAAPSAGVPLVCLPMGRDQPAVAHRVTDGGLGVSLDLRSSVDEIRAAAASVLSEPAFIKAAHRLAAKMEPPDRIVREIDEAVCANLEKTGVHRTASR